MGRRILELKEAKRGNAMLKTIEQVLEMRHATNIPLEIIIVGVSAKMFTRGECVCDCACNGECDCIHDPTYPEQIYIT